MSAAVQRRSLALWETGSQEERDKAAAALDHLRKRKKDVDHAARTRERHKEAFRHGGQKAADLVWVQPLLEEWTGEMGAKPISALRRVEDWNPPGRTADLGRMRLALARHMYGRYPTPAFLDALWVTEPRRHPGPPAAAALMAQPGGVAALGELVYAPIWRAVASGTSLHKSCFAPNAILSRRETHLFLGAPGWCTVTQALWWARVLSLSESRLAADILARSRLPDFAGPGTRTPDPRWIGVARFFGQLIAQGTDALRGEELAEALDWVRASMGQAEWTMEGRTAATVRRSTKEWHRFQIRQKEWSKNRWDGYPVDPWRWEEGEPGRESYRLWTLTQITTGRDLAAEGHAQRHCVGSYIGMCSRGECAIFSLQVAGPSLSSKRALTVEVDKHWRIVQAKGFANRAPSGAESRALGRWAAETGITWR
jgi:hypothetical protein